ncbi:MAG: redoxin domain-containing protein [Bacteroidota bacterium]|nr:redoxin domain-containing protein [Bacteroidota bacterium]
MKQNIVQQVVKGSFVITLIGLVSATSIVAQDIQQLPLGSTLPLGDVQMEDISGRNLSLNEVKGDNGLLVIFSCNTCPWVIKWEDRYPLVQELATVNDIGIILLNPNEDYRDKGDGMEDMILHAEKAGYNLPYVLDKNHRVADAFGASRTPHVYLFNAEDKLVYVGAIDDNANSAADVEEFYLEDAIEQLSAGQAITRSSTKSIGCTIKRLSN